MPPFSTLDRCNYLSVAANNTGATTLQLNDAPLDLITNTGTGTETSSQTYADSDHRSGFDEGNVAGGGLDHL